MILSKLAKSQPETGLAFLFNHDKCGSVERIQKCRNACPKNALTFPVQTVRILNLEIWMEYGPVAQLGARFNRTEEVEGSNPSRSIREKVSILSKMRAHSARSPLPGRVGSAMEYN